MEGFCLGGGKELKGSKLQITGQSFKSSLLLPYRNWIEGGESGTGRICKFLWAIWTF